MSNTNTNLQTQTSNALYNAIMEAGRKDCPPMLAPGIYNGICSTVDACPNACEMWKATKRLKQVNKTIAKRPARTANPLALIAQQQPIYHPQNHHNHYTHNSSTRSQQAATKNRGKAIVNSPLPTYDQEPEMVAKDDALSKEKEIDKLVALISLSFKKIYKSTNNNLRTSSNISRENQDNTLRSNRGTGYDNQRAVNVIGARENVGTHVVQQSGIQCYNCKEYGHVAREYQKPKRAKDTTYHKEKMLLYAANNYGPIFDVEPLQKVQNDDDNYNVFANDSEHHEQPESVNDTCLKEHGDTDITIDSLDMSTNGETVDQDDDDLAKECDLLASLIEKLKCEIDDNKNRNKFLKSSNKILIDKLKDLKKFQAKLDRYHYVNCASKVEIDCVKAKGGLMSYKMESQKSLNEHTRKINDLNQTISEMKKELFAHQETISIMSQEKEAQKKFHKTREDKELEKVIALENKIKVLDDIVYKTGQSVQTMNMLNRNCKTSFVKPEFLKKAQRANPRLYDIGCYNDNLALMLAPESDETIRLAQESRSKLSDLIKPFDYKNLNNLYDLFVPQREKSPEQRYFSERSKMSHTPVKNENSKESFNKQTTLLEKRMDESIPWDQKCKSSKELFKIKSSVDMIFDGVERCKQTIAKRTYFGHIDPFIQNTIEGNFCPQI
ncbi:integrase, catalytic region, zinc finger, CCHC-type containing protein [Tanacetum coccineum]